MCVKAPRHNRQVSIAKAIGIILMVTGHSGCPEYLHDFIYLFHMPLFYFLSAYFFRDEKVTKNCGQYVMRKFKNLYWPYVKWSFIFLLLHNVFYHVGFYDNSLTLSEIYVNAKCSIRGIWQGERMLGAYWFLISLFWESILFGLIIWMKHKIQCRYFDFIAVVVLFLVGYYAPINFPINREMVLLPIFYLGYLTSKHKVDLSSSRSHLAIGLLFCLPALAVMAVFIKIVVSQSLFYNPILFLVGASLGIYLIMIISSKLVDTQVGSWLDRLGRATMSVLTFHFLSFKILTLLLIIIGIYPVATLAQWPVPSGHGYNNLWALYAVVGLLGPVYFAALIMTIKVRLQTILNK